MQGTTAYLPCYSGIIAVRAVKSPAALHPLWSSGTGGGPATLAAGLVWTLGQNGMLYGLSPITGAVRQQTFIGAPANHFPTPSVADGLLLAPTADQVVAFAAPAATPTAPVPYASPAAGTTTPAPSRTLVSQPSSPPAAASSGLPAGSIAGLVVVGLVVIGAVGWLVWRRRTTGSR